MEIEIISNIIFREKYEFYLAVLLLECDINTHLTVRILRKAWKNVPAQNSNVCLQKNFGMWTIDTCKHRCAHKVSPLRRFCETCTSFVVDDQFLPPKKKVHARFLLTTISLALRTRYRLHKSAAPHFRGYPARASMFTCIYGQNQ